MEFIFQRKEILLLRDVTGKAAISNVTCNRNVANRIY